MKSTEKTEKVYLSRDEDDKFIWIWGKPKNGPWAPIQLKDCETVNWQRENRSLENTSHYLVKNFKRKYGFLIRSKTKVCKHLDRKLLNNQDYKEVSDDPDRKK